MERILVVGANGQIGSELVEALAARHGDENVIAADIGPASSAGVRRYEKVDVLDAGALSRLIDRYAVTQVYQLAALLSVTGEQDPLKAWHLNTTGLLNILEIARERRLAGNSLQVFWPSSIAAFGPHTPPVDTPQTTVMDPTTIYGISKQAGERLCTYYFNRYGVDVRSLRYPGIISHRAPPGGGTTDYAIAMFHAAVRGEPYVCYLEAGTRLPMMYMSDAIRATLLLMDAAPDRLRIRSSYNVAGLSFTPAELAAAIRRRKADFSVIYRPDEREAIAQSWPRSIDDAAARADWGWEAHIGLEELTADMLAHIQPPPAWHAAA